jgi:hypothetical protein
LALKEKMLDPVFIKKRYKNYSPTLKQHKKNIDYSNFGLPHTIDSKLKVIGVLKPDSKED